jgi:hypothetical protein
MFMSCHQNAGENDTLMIVNKSFANVAMFIYLGTDSNISKLHL